MEEKKYYWIKLRTDFFNQETMDFLLSQKNGCEYVVLYQMLCLQTANTDGRLVNQVGEMIVPFNVEKIVRDTKYFDYDTVVVALELYKQIGLIYTEDDGNLKISGLTDMVGSETKWAEKKRIYREKQKMLGQQKDIVLQENRDKRLDIRDIDNKIIDSSSIYDYYQNEIGTLTPRQYEIISNYLNIFNEDIIKEAINRASDNNGKTFKYVEAILKSWKQKGYKTLEDIQNELRNKKDKDVPVWFNKELDSEELDNNELQELEKEMSIFE